MATVNQKILNALDTYNTEKDVQLEATYVKQITGKGLSANDYTTTEKNKLAGIANNANNYSLPAATSSALGGVKVGDNITNSSGKISLSQANVIGALGYTPPDKNPGTATALGLSKLYTGTGSAVDGSMTQAAITTQLNQKANLASPTLTGTPAAPTAANSANTTQIATTAFVHNAQCHYGVSNTGANDANKTVTVDDFVLVKGATVNVQFTNGFGLSFNPTLNVNNTGAKQIVYRGHRPSPLYFTRYSTFNFVYDGTYWIVTNRLTFDAVDLCGNVWIKNGDPFLASDHAGIQCAVELYDSGSLQLEKKLTLGGGDFSVDFWSFMHPRHTTYNVPRLVTIQNDWKNRIWLYWVPDNGYYLNVQLLKNGTELVHVEYDQETTWNTFAHHAFAYDHTNHKFYVFLNGVLKSTTSNVTLDAKEYTVTLGGRPYAEIGNGGNASCAIDEFRISDCVRWTEDFDVPTTSFGVDEHTLVMCRFQELASVE